METILDCVASPIYQLPFIKKWMRKHKKYISHECLGWKKLEVLVRASFHSWWDVCLSELSGNATTGKMQGTLKPLNQTIYRFLVGSWCLPPQPDSLLWISLPSTFLALNRNLSSLSPLLTWIAVPWIITFFCCARDPKTKQTWMEKILRGFKTWMTMWKWNSYSLQREWE